MVEKQPLLRRHGLVRAEDVLERRDIGPFGMAALQGLPELLRIAEQHEAFGGLRDRQHVGQRELSGLVHEQHVHCLEKSSRAQSQAVPAATCAAPDRIASSVSGCSRSP